MLLTKKVEKNNPLMLKKYGETKQKENQITESLWKFGLCYNLRKIKK